MAYELYSHMLKHIYWGSYTIAIIPDIPAFEHGLSTSNGTFVFQTFIDATDGQVY